MQPVYEADCQPPRVKVRKATKVLQKEIMDNINKCITKKFEDAYNDNANHAILLIFLRSWQNLKCGGIWTTIISASAMRFRSM